MANINGKPPARVPDYTDLDLDFGKQPGTNDIAKKYGDEAIKRSIRNLVQTNFYERPFRSHIGSNARKLLFENFTPITGNNLKQAVIEVITNFEPRVSLLGVVVDVTPDLNTYVCAIKYRINNRIEPTIQSIILERIR